eukprot:1099984-Amphidinium_carterae.1
MKTPGQIAELTGISSQMYPSVALWQDALRAKIEQNQAASADTWPRGQEAIVPGPDFWTTEFYYVHHEGT